MITNLLILVFVGLAALWFSNQGLFSALLHLVVTLCAGAIGFGLWEPLTLNYLLDRMPEYAWGVGLLVPFAVALLLLRTAVDWLVPGNVKFHNLVDSIGGGAVGVVNGMLAGGLLILGLQFVGNFALGGYQPYARSVDGAIERTQKLWIPVDDFAGSVFTGLSAGAFQPLDGKTMPVYQPNIIEAAGTFRLTSRDGARRAIRPAWTSCAGRASVFPALRPACRRVRHSNRTTRGYHSNNSSSEKALVAAAEWRCPDAAISDLHDRTGNCR